MYLNALQLYNFRNYEGLTIRFSPGLNVVYGNNAQGKTNLLEAMYYLATGRSHRTSRDQEMIRQGATSLRVRAEVVRQTGRLDLDLTYGQTTRKGLRINGVPEQKIAKLVGKLAVVFFSPDDLQLIKGPPALRRRFLDIELSQTSPTYLHYLQRYKRLLTQRNALLRQASLERTQPKGLEVWNEQLLTVGAEIMVRRLEALRELAPFTAAAQQNLSEGAETLTLEYESQSLEKGGPVTVEAVRAALAERLASVQHDELRRGTTLLGPHRDDLIFKINGKDARSFASQGQTRTAVLALKLAELAFMQEALGENPVLLLDDVTSELDPTRRHYLLHSVETGVQTFVSCTDLTDLSLRTWPPEHRVFRVEAGQVVDQGGRL